MLKLWGPVPELRVLEKEFRFRAPNYFRAPSYQVYVATDGRDGWDGYLNSFKMRFPKGEPAYGLIRRGFKDDILEKLDKHRIEYDGSKLLKSPFFQLVPDDLPEGLIKGEFDLDENQRRCITEWLKFGFGVNQMAVNSGKTATFAGAAAMIKQKFPKARFLYFTQTERLVNQVTKELRTNFLPGWDIAQFGGGKNDLIYTDHKTGEKRFKPWAGKDIVVATGASLNRHFKKLVEHKWFNSFMGVLVDESHHACSPTWEQVLTKIPAFFRLGASDSVKESDPVKYNAIRGLLGPVRDGVEIAETIDMGRSAKPYIYLVDDQSWAGRYAAFQHQAEEDTPCWVLLDGEWKKGVYLGHVYERAVPDERGNFSQAESDGFKRVKAKVNSDGNYNEGEEDGFKRDENGDTIKIVVQSQHRILIEEDEYEIPSRWCLLERLYDKAIIQFKQRNTAVADWAEFYSQKSWQTLVVATRTLHVLILEALIKKRVGEEMVKILFSENSTKERDEVFEWFKNTPGSILITPLVKEGVSINEIRAGVIADPVVDWEVMKQILGRFVRKKIKGAPNEAHITAFIDRQHPRFKKNSVELYRKLEKVRGFTFFHPVIGPETIPSSTRYESLI